LNYKTFLADDFLEVEPDGGFVNVIDAGDYFDYDLSYEEYLEILEEMKEAIEKRIQEVKTW